MEEKIITPALATGTGASLEATRLLERSIFASTRGPFQMHGLDKQV